MNLFIVGLLLGWGVAVPVGPLNLEIIRRNLQFGLYTGFAIGLGACTGDITYLILLSAGILSLFNTPLLLKVFSACGALILSWFAYQALKSSPSNVSVSNSKRKPWWRHYLEAYALVMLSPYTVLFWFSVATQLSSYTHKSSSQTLFMSAGVLCGVLSWQTFLNLLVHKTKHRLSERTMRILNRVGGIILIGFALLCFVRVFHA